MSAWQWVGQAAESGFSAIGSVLDWVGGMFAGIGDSATRRQVAFSIALIALSAKMAKADGVVTHDEVGAFRGIFAVPPGEEAHVRRLFDLAKRDVAGYDAYARRIALLYDHDRAALTDVIDGLFAIAKADGAVHDAEYAYLQSVAKIFGIDGADFDRIAARHVITAEGDPYAVLGVDRAMTFAEIRARYRALVVEHHPDRAMARGMPPDFVAIATGRTAEVNRAWQRIEEERGRS